MHTPDRPDDRSDTGRRGEELAARLLEASGYTIVHRNLRLPCGELDLVAARPGELRFVEVRTVRTQYLPATTEAVNRTKRRQVARVANAYLCRWPQPGRAVSCDVIGVALPRRGEPQLTWIRDAFGDGGEPM